MFSSVPEQSQFSYGCHINLSALEQVWVCGVKHPEEVLSFVVLSACPEALKASDSPKHVRTYSGLGLREKG